MAGFLGNVLGSIGQNMVIGQQQDEKRAETEYKQQQVASMKMANLAAKQQQQTQQEVGAYLKSEIDKDSSIMQDPLKTAAAYERAAGMAAAHGDLVSMQEMGKLAKGKLDEAKEAQATALAQNKVSKEAAASAAYDYDSAPTVDNAAKLAQAAVKAGYDPTKIPAPGSIAFKAFANNLKTNALDAKSRAELVEKAQEFQVKQQEKREEHADKERDFQLRRQDMAIRQAGLAEDRKMRLGMERERLDLAHERVTAQQDPNRQTPTMRQANNAIVSSASEALRGSKLIEQLPNDQTAGPFQGLSDGTILGTLAKTGGNVLTPEGTQIYQTMTAGMGLELARVMTLGAGRGANQATIDEMQHIITAHPGDTNATALFKYANGVDIVRNRLETLPETTDPKVQKQRQELEEYLKKVPTPTQVLAAIKDPKVKAKVIKEGQSMREAAAKAQNEAENPGAPSVAPASAPATPGLPTGWSVKVH